MIAFDDVGLRFPALASCMPDGCGALLLPLAKGTGDAILWFRPEQSLTVRWGGNPAEHGRIDPVVGLPSPRTSFAVWQETVRGRSTPWQPIDLTIVHELRDAIDIEAGNRIRLELATLRHVHLESEKPNQQRTAELEEFAYAASHDMKAPLRAIEHLAQWIGEDIESTAAPETVENLRLLKGRVRRLQFLLNGLLAYSRVGRQVDAASIKPVDISALVGDTVGQLALPAGFKVVWEANLPVIRTDRVQIQVVLTNLIGNAVKHHDRTEGRIEVSAHMADGMAEFRVSDDGPGIPRRFHDRIFVVFQTLASRDEVEGSGIGLAIVKKMVLSNGGTIRVESAPPVRGSTFVFTWKEAAS
jgi:light-regulated signal transduction histidine kinase (bacteriophytochrome)